MLINAGRLLMLFVWGFLALNLVHPFARPLNIFINVALIFMALMHALQMLMLQSTLPKQDLRMSRVAWLRLFLFGVVELLAWQKKLKPKK